MRYFYLVLVVLFLVGPLIGVLVSVAMARLRRGAAMPQSVSPQPPSILSLFARFQFVHEFAWLVVPFVVIASFGMTTDPRAFLSRWEFPTMFVTPTLPQSPANAGGVETNRVPIAAVSTSGTSPRPAWVDKPREAEGDGEQIVLTSQQYSTKEEAEQELRAAAVQLVEHDLQRLQTGSFRPSYWRPAADEVIAHAVKGRYDDVTERDFGTFTHPMHRVSWQVELSPAVRTEFMPAWRRELVSFRILLVAVVASLFAMAASVGVMCFRLDSLTQGRSRGVLKLLAGGVMAGWLGLVVTSFSQGHLW